MTIAATLRTASNRGYMAALCAIAGGILVSGCVQSTSTRAKPASVAAPAPVATGEPVVLSGVGYTAADVAANPPPTGPSTTDIVTPAGPINPALSSEPLPGSAPPIVATPVQPPAAPVPVIEPLPGTPPPVASTGAAPVISAPTPPGVTPAPAVTADGYPNINVPPRQPGGQLLTPEERAKLIAELNALAGRPSGAQ